MPGPRLITLIGFYYIIKASFNDTSNWLKAFCDTMFQHAFTKYAIEFLKLFCLFVSINDITSKLQHQRLKKQNVSIVHNGTQSPMQLK